MSATEAAGFVQSLKGDAPSAVSAIKTLTASTNVAERLLGFFLLLEVQGTSDETLGRATTDVSPHIRAEVADWLYLNGRFEDWDSFLSKIVATLPAAESESLYTLLDDQPVRMDLPAAMSILGLGRGLPNLVVEILRRNGDALAIARQQVNASGTPSTRQENLVSLLHLANPAGYVSILEDIISVSEDDRPLRWQAVWQYGQTASGKESVSFLSARMVQHPQDRLFERLKEALIVVSNRTTGASASVSELERRLKNGPRTQQYTQDSREQKLIAYYVDLAKRDRLFVPDLDLLRSIQNDYPTNTTGDYPSRRTKADINYLIWRTKRK